MAYRIKYSDYSTTASGPPDPEAWVGPPGPPGPPGPLPEGAPFLPLSGGTVGSTPFGQTTFAFSPVNPRNGSGALMLNKVSGAVAGDDPQLTSYWKVDQSTGIAPYHTRFVTDVSGNVGVWALMNQSYIDSNDTGVSNGHVGFYSQQIRRRVNAGGARGIASWCSVMELRSQTGLPSSQDGVLQTLELDLLANGADDLSHSIGYGRTVMSIVIGQDNPGGAPVEVSNGISFFMYSAAPAGHYINMITAAAPFTGSVLSTIGATQQSGANAIWLRDGHNIAFDTAGTKTARWDGSNIRFTGSMQTTAGTSLNGLGNWSSFSVGKQLLITSGGHPAIAFTDSAGGNLIAAMNYAGQFAVAGMPAYVDSTTGPSFYLAANAAGITSYAAMQIGGSSGPTWTTGSGVPSSTQPVGSIYSRVSTWSAGATLYVSKGGGAWTPVASV